MKTPKDFDLFISANLFDCFMWLHLLALFYVYIGIYSSRPIRFRGAPTGPKDDKDDKEQGSPNTCSSKEHNFNVKHIRILNIFFR